MSQLEITIATQPAAFRPGETLTGDATWELSEDRPWVEIRLCWTTEGNAGGGGDPVVALRERLEVAGREGKHSFRFTLPDGPWSFEGRLFTVQWYVELALDDYRYRRAEFVLSPTGAAIRVVPADNPR